MAFEIRIKPLVLFDLEDKIKNQEYRLSGSGRELYQNFLSTLTELQQHPDLANPVYEQVHKFISHKLPCELFYMIKDNIIFVMGLL